MEWMTQLRAVRSRYEEIGLRLQDPAAVSDQARYRALMKDYKALTPIMEAFDAYRAAERSFEEARSLLGAGGEDPELRELAQAEYDESRDAMARLSQELRLLLLPRDENEVGGQAS